MTELGRAALVVTELERRLRDQQRPPPSAQQIRAALRVAEEAGLFGALFLVLQLARERGIDVWA